MSDKIYREVATKKDLLTSPMNKRYAVICKSATDHNSGISCYSEEKKGLLGEYDDGVTAEETALAHEHPVIIRFKALHQAKFYDH